MPTLADFEFDGLEALRWAITAPNGYPSIDQAVASLAVFIAPETVAQTPANIFRSARGRPRRTFDNADEPTFMRDDNQGAHIAFTAASGGIRTLGRNLTLNHIYGGRYVETFTNLRNLCITPTFLEKLTGHNPRTVALLKRRAFVLYGYAPEGEPKADGYDELIWAPTLPPVVDLRQRLYNALCNSEGHTARAVRVLGWCFNDFAGNPFPIAAG